MNYQASPGPEGGDQPVQPQFVLPVQQRGGVPAHEPEFGTPGFAQVPGPLAGFGARAISFLIDYIAPVIVFYALLLIGFATGGVAPRALFTVGYLGLLAFTIWNSWYLQGTTGQSIGRRVARTKLVKIETGQPIGFGMAFARHLCHFLEFIVGYLWPLWDDKRQTCADKIVGTVVIRIDG